MMLQLSSTNLNLFPSTVNQHHKTLILCCQSLSKSCLPYTLTTALLLLTAHNCNSGCCEHFCGLSGWDTWKFRQVLLAGVFARFERERVWELMVLVKWMSHLLTPTKLTALLFYCCKYHQAAKRCQKYSKRPYLFSSKLLKSLREREEWKIVATKV